MGFWKKQPADLSIGRPEEQFKMYPTQACCFD